MQHAPQTGGVERVENGQFSNWHWENLLTFSWRSEVTPPPLAQKKWPAQEKYHETNVGIEWMKFLIRQIASQVIQVAVQWSCPITFPLWSQPANFSNLKISGPKNLQASISEVTCCFRLLWCHDLRSNYVLFDVRNSPIRPPGVEDGLGFLAVK